MTLVRIRHFLFAGMLGAVLFACQAPTADSKATNTDSTTTAPPVVDVGSSVVTIDWDSPEFASLSFSENALTIYDGEEVTLEPVATEGLTDWRWFVDSSESENTDPTYTFTGEGPGFYPITVTAKYKGVTYSATINVTVLYSVG